MSASTETAKAELTAYEVEQVRQIAAWKSSPPNPLAEIFKMLALPGARAIEKVLPNEVVRASIEKAYVLSERLAGQEDVKRQAGIHDLGEMRGKPLEQCDRLANRVGTVSQVVSVAEGAATGALGPLTTLIDIPLLFVLSLQTILKIGHCYGYPLDRPKDRKYTLGVLLAATSGSLATRRKRLGGLREIEHWLLEETQQDIIAEEVASLLFQLEVFEQVPGVGALSGALLNLSFIRRVDLTARRVFQERWLKDNGKIDEILPAEVHARKVAPGWAGAFSRAAYSGCYYLGFGVTLPACYVASLFRPLDNALTRGVSDGAAAASEGVDRLLGSATREVRRSAPASEPAPA